MSTDEGAYDLFLHSQDKPFTVREIYAWVEESCGLAVSSFSQPGLYDPLLWLQSGQKSPSDELLRQIEALPLIERRVMAELLHGTMQRHSVCVAPTRRAQPQVEASTIPCRETSMDPSTWQVGNQLADGRVEVFRSVGANVASGLPKDAKVRYEVSAPLISQPWVFGDCEATFEALWTENAASSGMPLEWFLREMGAIVKMLEDFDDMVVLSEPAIVSVFKGNLNMPTSGPGR